MCATLSTNAKHYIWNRAIATYSVDYSDVKVTPSTETIWCETPLSDRGHKSGTRQGLPPTPHDIHTGPKASARGRVYVMSCNAVWSLSHTQKLFLTMCLHFQQQQPSHTFNRAWKSQSSVFLLFFPPGGRWWAAWKSLWSYCRMSVCVGWLL